jgi:hypothetical protein
MDSPVLVLVFSFAILWLSTQLGARLRRRLKDQSEAQGDFDLVLGATLTLLGLIIGFSFSMAISRYDQRKNSGKKRPTPSVPNISGLIYYLATIR